jgi:hypothetical protein
VANVYNEDPWNIIESESDGVPVVICACSSLPLESDRQLLPYMMVVMWRFDGNEIGMPPLDVVEKIAALDDAFGGPLDASGTCVEAAEITGNGLKEWRFM